MVRVGIVTRATTLHAATTEDTERDSLSSIESSKLTANFATFQNPQLSSHFFCLQDLIESRYNFCEKRKQHMSMNYILESSDWIKRVNCEVTIVPYHMVSREQTTAIIEMRRIERNKLTV